MRRLVVSIIAVAHAVAFAQGSPGSSLDPLSTPPPERVNAAERLPPPDDPEPIAADALIPATAPLSPAPATANLPATTDEELVSLQQGGLDAWTIDEQFVEDEVAAFEDSGEFEDPGSMEEAMELVRTAALQIETAEYRDAERTINDGLTMIEHQVGRYDPTLVDPLIVLGESLHGQGDYVEAIDAYERAVHVARINDGLHTPDQVEIIYREADSWAAMGEFEKANDRHEYAYEMLLRNYGPNSVELVPGMYRLAHWYSQQNDIFSARGLYQYAARALSLAYGAEDTRLIPALKGIAMTYRLERFPPYRRPDEASVSLAVGPSPATARSTSHGSVNRFGDGERALQQIVRIQEANPDATVSDITVAILDLADWNLMFEKWERAFTLYEFCYKILGEDGKVPADQLTTYFAEPRPLYLPLPDDPRVPDNLAVVPTEGFVELRYTVTERGYVHDLKTMSAQPKGLMDFKVRRAMRSARFRPQLVGGEAVPTPDLVYRHRFQYYPPKEGPDPDAEQTPEPSADAASEAS